MIVKTDCRQYRNSAPCTPHKQTQVTCDRCGDHDPIEQRIAIVKLDAMGDVLRTTAVLPALKRRYPRSHITWITRSQAAPLVAGTALVDRVLSIESNYLEFVLAEEFDLALGPDADLLSASIMSLVRSGEKRGFVSNGRGGVTPLNDAAVAWWQMGLDDTVKRANRRTYGEWLYAMCELDGPVARPCLQPSPAAREAADRFLHDRAPAARRVCFNTGAGVRWREKRWKPDHYRELARRIRADAPATAVVLVGGPEEAEFNAALLKTDAGFVDAGTSNSVDAFAGLIAACDWIVTSDSLGYHVACAVGTPAVCLVGPTSPWELDLYCMNQVVHADLECIACYLAECPFARTCMDSLTPGSLWPYLAHGETLQPRSDTRSAVRPEPVVS